MISWIVIFFLLTGSFLCLLTGVTWPLTITVVVILFKVAGKIDNRDRKRGRGWHYDYRKHPMCWYF